MILCSWIFFSLVYLKILFEPERRLSLSLSLSHTFVLLPLRALCRAAFLGCHEAIRSLFALYARSYFRAWTTESMRSEFEQEL